MLLNALNLRLAEREAFRQKEKNIVKEMVLA
jgi:hypothetical protein